MTRVAPNIYRYRTAHGPRFMVRVQAKAKDLWRRGFLSQAQASEYLSRLRADLVEARHFPDRQPAPTLREYAPQWLEHMALRGLKHNTLRGYRDSLRVHVLPAFGDLTLDAITRQEIITFMLKKRTKGLAPNTIRLMLAPLSALLTHAMEAGLITQNPAMRPSRIIPVRRRQGNIEIFTEQEEHNLLSACRRLRPDHYPLLVTLFRTGLRIGEALALERTDLHFTTRWISVTKNYTNTRLESLPKGGRTRRVMITGQVSAVLAEHLKTHTSSVVFPGTSTYLHLRSWRRWVWERILKETNLKPRGLHAIRHSYATRELEAGKSLIWVKQQLGHSSIQVTVDTYGHFSHERV